MRKLSRWPLEITSLTLAMTVCLSLRGSYPKQSPPAAPVIEKAKPEAIPKTKIASLLVMTETVLFGGQCPPYIEIVFNTKFMKNMKKDRI
ncbi:MAG: hypothetical protein ACUBOA_10050 [Candidatus Loosdrechtia sp.]|uniref:hypothetical protein n=1 Tax=Candidatus Loosdrechtia sp. TaxID=3101272 RepID=UPI003A618DC1|nr:MAG: hypothetical protein QY305_11010 [Candidatus Jettenia sp. AMX2]